MLPDPTARFINPLKGSSSPGFRAGLHIAKVSRVTDGKIFVVVPTVNPGQVIGPCTAFTDQVIDAGDIVVVGFLDNKMENLVVLGREA